MRKRRRYIAFELMGEASVTDVLQVINFLRTSGPEAEQPTLRLVLYDEGSRRGLLRCGHRHVDEIKASITNAGKTCAKQVSFRVLGVSGTIRAAKRKFLALRRAKD
jgi:ribonuclease P/MRP protein subunit POP5